MFSQPANSKKKIFWTFWLIGWLLVFFWMGLAGLRLLWPIIEPLLPIIFQTEAVESIGKSFPFTWWPNLTNETGWFGLNVKGHAVLQFLLGLVCCIVGWGCVGRFIFVAIPRLIGNRLKTGRIFDE